MSRSLQELAPAVERRGVWALAGLAAIGAAMAGTAATGTQLWDELLAALIGGLFVLAATKAPRWISIPAATLAAALADSLAWTGVGAAALMLAVGATLLHRRSALLEAAAAALALQGLLRLADVGFFGLPSILAGTVIVIALWFGYRALRYRHRQAINWTAIVVVFLTAIAGTLGGLMILGARTDVETGIEAARSGLSAARGGQPDEVVAELEDAARSLANADDQVSGALTQPLRLIPIAAQHHRAITTAVSQGRALATQASRATINADISSISMSAGGVDLASLSAMQPDLEDTASLLEEAIVDIDEVRTGWLVPQIDTRLADLNDEMADVVPEARVAADAARVVPGLLGADGPRRYFVAFGSPAESRELGGFVGSWAVIEFNDGNLDLVEAGRIRDLYELVRGNGRLAPGDYPLWYAGGSQPDIWPQNIASSPELSVVAQASREIFDGIGGGPIDGFIYLDGYVLGDVLELSGPITIEDLDGRISASNADDFFFDQQYRLLERDEVKNELGAIFDTVVGQLLDRELPGPERLGRILGPVARQGRLQIATFDDDENAFLASIYLQRTFEVSPVAVDSVAVIQRNGSQSKLDLYLHRDITYDVEVDDDGLLTGTITVELTSSIPADAPSYALGRDDPGWNLVLLSLYTPHSTRSARIDGAPTQPRQTREFGYWRNEVSVELRGGETRTLEFEVTGEVDLGRPYSLAVWHQPLVNEDAVHVNYVGPDGRGTVDHTLIESTELTVPLS